MAVIVVVPNPETTTELSRITACLVSSLRAVRGQVPAADRIQVVEFADLRARRESGRAVEAGRTPVDVGAGPVAGDGGGICIGPPAEAPRAEADVASAADPDAEPDTASSTAPAPAADPEAARAVESAVLEGWWQAAVRSGQGRGSPEDTVAALAATPHFRAQARAPRHIAAELRRYLTDRKFRHELRDRTQACIGPETRVVIGHSLGAVIAYEALCAVSDSTSVTLVTLGAAMCGPEVVFERLDPAPRNNQGEWPAAVRHWCNIVAHTDLTALSSPRLTDRFGPGIDDLVIEPRSVTEALNGYLLDRSTGLAVATGLAAEIR